MRFSNSFEILFLGLFTILHISVVFIVFRFQHFHKSSPVTVPYYTELVTMGESKFVPQETIIILPLVSFPNMPDLEIKQLIPKCGYRLTKSVHISVGGTF